MKHIIEGIILEQHCDCDIITFLDTSKYIDAVGIIIENPMLQIFPPNWDKYFSIKYNTNAVTLIRPEHINHNTLPSGVYHFIQSICPNDKLKNEFCYLNICKELNRISKLACEYLEDDESLEKLFEIKMSLEVAQDLVGYGEVHKGTNLYNTAVKMLSILENKKDCDIC